MSFSCSRILDLWFCISSKSCLPWSVFFFYYSSYSFTWVSSSVSFVVWVVILYYCTSINNRKLWASYLLLWARTICSNMFANAACCFCLPMPSNAEPNSLQIDSSLSLALRVSSAFCSSNIYDLGCSVCVKSCYNFIWLNKLWVCWDYLRSSSN